MPTGRPAAMCGSAPIVIPAAVTAITCNGEIRSGGGTCPGVTTSWIDSSSA